MQPTVVLLLTGFYFPHDKPWIALDAWIAF
jgi:hypothetical protein